MLLDIKIPGINGAETLPMNLTFLRQNTILIIKMKMAEKEKIALKEYTDQLHKLYPENIEKIILFGSRARGDAGEGSDIDILVVVKKGDKEVKNKITDLSFDIILKYGVDVEPAIFDSEEWARLTEIPTSFTYCVLNEGKVL